jgi:hypothetical protein
MDIRDLGRLRRSWGLGWIEWERLQRLPHTVVGSLGAQLRRFTQARSVASFSDGFASALNNSGDTFFYFFEILPVMLSLISVGIILISTVDSVVACSYPPQLTKEPSPQSFDNLRWPPDGRLFLTGDQNTFFQRHQSASHACISFMMTWHPAPLASSPPPHGLLLKPPGVRC